ncbi:MAG: biopolymer transporter ExbD [Bacteroidales bacterium]
MAEIQEKGDGKEKKVRQKKMSIHVDFTPMVDMNMLLITFFMLCTSLSKPQTMEISMPTKDKVTEEEQTKVKESNAITIILGDDNKIFYYQGMPNYEDYTSLKSTSYNADGLRSLLLNKNQNVVKAMKDLKQKKLELKISQEEFEKQAAEIKKDKTAPVVMIKATDQSTYKNLIDVLDEMQICNIAKYAIVDITDGDQFLVENLKSQGSLTNQIEHSASTKK